MKVANAWIGWLSCLAIVPLPALAGGWQGPVSISGYSVNSDSNGARIYIWPSAPVNPDACTPGGTQIRIDGSVKRGQYFLATVQLAIASNRRVTMNLSGCDDWGWPVAIEMALAP